MSAFVVGNDHVNAILTWGVKNGIYIWDKSQGRNVTLTSENADAFGQILMDENCRSYNYRYQREDVDALDYAFRPFPVELTPQEVIKACSCLDYQSCETPDWPETTAAQILREIVGYAVGELPAVKACEVWEVRTDSALANSPARSRKRA